MKVIFLDFDGVLNSMNYSDPNQTSGVLIDPTRMLLLKQIIDATGAKIVLSTSWREHWDADAGRCNEAGKEINRIFCDAGLTVFDKIPRLHTLRDNEIKEWLSVHPEVKNYLVIDDMPCELGSFRGHFILTSNVRNGLDEDDVREAIKVLSDRQS